MQNLCNLLSRIRSNNIREFEDIGSGPKPMGLRGAAPPPQETICWKILLSCRNFYDSNDWFWRIMTRNNALKHEFISVKTQVPAEITEFMAYV